MTFNDLKDLVNSHPNLYTNLYNWYCNAPFVSNNAEDVQIVQDDILNEAKSIKNKLVV